MGQNQSGKKSAKSQIYIRGLDTFSLVYLKMVKPKFIKFRICTMNRL